MEDKMGFSNAYEDRKRADAYSKLEFPGTYYLAYRDLPKIIATHVKGTDALDFGCGTGRSTRFLQKLGFNTIGVDISEEMLKKAKETDPKGDYRLIPDGNFSQLKDKKFDLVLSAFTFDNIPTMEKKVKILLEIRKLLNSYGKIVNLVCSPEIYIHEWASFSTIDFPENKTAKGGDKVRIIITDTEDKRPVEDILWPPDYYRVTYEKSSLMIAKVYKPIAEQNEIYKWINETRIAPWTIYVLQKCKT
ncbi:methyltransferase domain-containing protein [Candidatus Bathyarchaeota archaeon]|nr:methyltransferase domain-containing protein [Candidatus Bathyarchaeota archaeon]